MSTKCDATGKWSLPADCLNYTGHKPRYIDKEVHPLEKPYKRTMALGYSGFIPNAITMTGGPSHLGLKEELVETEKADLVTNFRNYGKNLDIIERYTTAIEALKERGQTPMMLLRLVQNKCAERVNSYAEQKKNIRLLFEAMDVNNDKVLDENEFRVCMEKINVQLDDVQILALFAYFDCDYSGHMSWEEFAEKTMVHNPKGGNAILPKSINATLETGMWDDVMYGRGQSLDRDSDDDPNDDDDDDNNNNNNNNSNNNNES